VLHVLHFVLVVFQTLPKSIGSSMQRTWNTRKNLILAARLTSAELRRSRQRERTSLGNAAGSAVEQADKSQILPKELKSGNGRNGSAKPQSASR
jgi:hypothetical protein